MLGLLGGLLGRGLARPRMGAAGRRPLMGLLGGRLARNAINPRQARPSALAGRQAPQEPEEPDPEQQQTVTPQEQVQPAQQQEAAPQQQPTAQVQPAQKVSANLQEVEQDRQQTLASPEQKVDQRPLTADLLDDAPPVVAQQQPQTEEKVAPPDQMVNQTESLSPVAQQADQQFGQVPELFLSGLVDRIGDQPPRRFFAAEDPVPTRPADVKSQAKHTGNRPEMSFGLANAATSYTPTYSYRRS